MGQCPELLCQRSNSLLLVAVGQRAPASEDVVFFLFVRVFAAYEISLLVRQHRFYQMWERRIGALLYLEDTIMKEMDEQQEKT